MNIVKDIRGHHFKLGDSVNDYQTTHNHTFNFDKNKAKNAKSDLKEDLLNDLRATHYKLGYDPNKLNFTSNQSTYKPYNTLKNEKVSNNELRKHHIDFNPMGTGQQNRTIYMTDYTKKEIIADQ